MQILRDPKYGYRNLISKQDLDELSHLLNVQENKPYNLVLFEGVCTFNNDELEKSTPTVILGNDGNRLHPMTCTFNTNNIIDVFPYCSEKFEPVEDYQLFIRDIILFRLISNELSLVKELDMNKVSNFITYEDYIESFSIRSTPFDTNTFDITNEDFN